jgi:hypothetical protein
MDRPISLNYDKYVQFKKQLLAVVKQNESFLKLKDTMQISALKADYDKFYNNPDKTKQDRYQAWLKLLAKDIQINESSKLLNELAKEKVVVSLK